MTALAHAGAARSARIVFTGCLLALACTSDGRNRDDASLGDDASLRDDASLGDDASSRDDASTRDDGSVPGDGSLTDDASVGDPRFSWRLEGTELWIDHESDAPSYQLSCSGWAPVIERKTDAGWVELRDDRHPSWNNPGYFLDGVFIEPSFNLGCDVISCAAITSAQRAGSLLEYVKTGTADAPDYDDTDAGWPEPGQEVVDTIQSAPAEGPFRVRFSYSSSAQCEAPREVVLELDPASSAEDLLCGRRPGGDPYGEHVLRFETEGGDVVQLVRIYEGIGVGESAIYSLAAFHLRIGGTIHCVEDEAALEYENTHHNWFDVVHGTVDGHTYTLDLPWAADDELSGVDEQGDVVYAARPVIATGSPTFCSMCPMPLRVGISELVVSNASLLQDEAGDYEPVIELFNPTTDAVSLEGWWLSDDLHERQKWSLPAVTIGRHEALLVFADGEQDEGALHASFELSASGGELILTAPDGSTDGGLLFGQQMPDYGFAFDWSVPGYGPVLPATPGEVLIE